MTDVLVKKDTSEVSKQLENQNGLEQPDFLEQIENIKNDLQQLVNEGNDEFNEIQEMLNNPEQLNIGTFTRIKNSIGNFFSRIQLSIKSLIGQTMNRRNIRKNSFSQVAHTIFKNKQCQNVMKGFGLNLMGKFSIYLFQKSNFQTKLVIFAFGGITYYGASLFQFHQTKKMMAASFGFLGTNYLLKQFTSIKSYIFLASTVGVIAIIYNLPASKKDGNLRTPPRSPRSLPLDYQQKRRSSKRSNRSQKSQQ